MFNLYQYNDEIHTLVNLRHQKQHEYLDFCIKQPSFHDKRLKIYGSIHSEQMSNTPNQEVIALYEKMLTVIDQEEKCSENEKKRLQDIVKTVEAELNSAFIKYYNDIVMTIEPKDIFYQYIHSDTSTRLLLDEFDKASEQIMLLRDVFKTNRGQWISLFIIRREPFFELHENNPPVMTEIKKSIGRYPNNYYPGRLIHLIEEIYDVVDEDTYYPNKTRFALNTPCSLNGQDSRLSDTYGDTWSYMVIGVEITN